MRSRVEKRSLLRSPVIVSASRSTDIPAFYSDWFVERFSFIDIAAYKKVAANLERGGIKAREFQSGEYNTCPHLCHYCYANTNNVAALANWKQHLACPHAETITGK